MKRIVMKYINRVLALFAIVSLSFACGEEYQYFPDISKQDGAKFKFVHAATDTTGIEFTVNGVLASPGGNGIGYFYAFPVLDYAVQSTGNLNLNIQNPATDTTDAVLMVSTSVSAQTNDYFTVALVGVSGSYEAVAISDNMSAIPFDDKSYVRVINFIHDSPNGVSLELTNALGTSVVADKILFKEGSAFVAVEPGSYSSIKLLDSNSGNTLSSAASSRRTLLPNRVYTFYGKGSFANASIDRMYNR